MTINPPSVPKRDLVDDFLDGAGKVPMPDNKLLMPWEKPNVRKDVKKAMQLVLSEAYMLKLQYLADKTCKSQARIAREAVERAIDTALEALY